MINTYVFKLNLLYHIYIDNFNSQGKMMLDDLSLIKQRDPQDALGVAASEYKQTDFEIDIQNAPSSPVQISNVIVTGMGGSALAAMTTKVWLKNEVKVPFEIYRSYDIPAYLGQESLVIASSYSGNTEETLSFLEQSQSAGATLAILASGGKLIELASQSRLTFVQLPSNMQPRMAVNYNLKALASLLVSFGLIDSSKLDELSAQSVFLDEETKNWLPSVPTSENYAKQLAMTIAGKTPVFYGGSLTSPVAYKFKISINENSKNVAIWNEYPEVSHNEFLGWSSHPIEKPFAVFDIISSLEHAQILRRFDLTDKLLSGKRPKANRIELRGESLIAQLLWGGLLADFVGIYLGILNGVDPTQVDLIEKLKNELK